MFKKITDILKKKEALFLEAGILRITEKGRRDALLEARDRFSELIDRFQPAILAIEKLYFVRNQKTGLEVAEARGVILGVAVGKGLEIKEYTPNEIKAGVTGYGFADKRAVAKMVKLILKRPDLNLIDDATDALAVALIAGRTPPPS